MRVRDEFIWGNPGSSVRAAVTVNEFGEESGKTVNSVRFSVRLNFVSELFMFVSEKRVILVEVWWLIVMELR